LISTLKKISLACTVIEFERTQTPMIVFTDDRAYAETLFPGKKPWALSASSSADPNLSQLISRLYRCKKVYTRASRMHSRWTHALAVNHAPSSHFDHLIALSRNNVELPDGTLCLAGSGRKFHGQRKRAWSVMEGNIHLSVYLSPHKAIKNFHTGFPVLVAVSLIETLDAFKSLKGRAMIKWVNDILINGAKVAGFLVHTLSVDESVLIAILGIGLNIEKKPQVKPDPFVPKVDALRSYVRDPLALNQEKVLHQLLRSLDKNYDLLLKGQYCTLLKSYKERSLVLGRRVKIVSDTDAQNLREIAYGRVIEIGESLELFIEGHKRPVTSGRLIFTPFSPKLHTTNTPVS
jgi:biotin-[acetyl-CoA-carboxylase] ligase BirA-like protein